MKIFDTLKNLVSGLGTSKDKSIANSYVVNEILPNDLVNMYRGDWISRKLVDIPPKDMTKTWRNWKAPKEAVEKIEALEKHTRIRLAANTCYALQMARLFGGSIMYFSIRGQASHTALDVERVRQDDLKYIRVFHKVEGLGEEGLRDDIEDEWYGHPEFYTVTKRTGEPRRIHPSRVIRFIGKPRPELLNTSVWWGDSVLQIAQDAVMNASASEQHVAALVPEAKTDVMYVPGLGQMLSTPEGTQALTARFQYAAMMKSMFNMVLLDGVGAETAEGESVGETWEQKQIRFADLPDLLTHFLQTVSGAADIPLTRFLGVSPAGLNATGESDLRNYYDGLAGDQRNELSPSLAAFDEVLIRSATGSREPSIYYEWAPLWLPTPKEQAEIFKNRAEGVKTLKDTMLIPAAALSEATVNMLIEDGTLASMETAIAKHGDFSSMSPEEQEAAKGITPEPPPVTEGAPGAPGATSVAARPARAARGTSPARDGATDQPGDTPTSEGEA